MNILRVEAQIVRELLNRDIYGIRNKSEELLVISCENFICSFSAELERALGNPLELYNGGDVTLLPRPLHTPVAPIY